MKMDLLLYSRNRDGFFSNTAGATEAVALGTETQICKQTC